MRRRMRVQDVVVGDRKRTLDQTKVAELAESLSRLGLLNPITVSDSGQLLAGLHRLEAARSLGWKWIDVTVTSLDELASELVEIDENLVRAELSVLERAEHLQRRRRIYEDIHPETVRPKGGRRPRNVVLASSFPDDAATKVGMTARSVRRDLQIAEGICEPARDTLRGTPVANMKSELLVVARMPPDVQVRVARKLAGGEAREAWAAERLVRAEDAARCTRTKPSARAAGRGVVARADCSTSLPAVNWGMTWPDRRYAVILADPPWGFRTYSAKGRGRGPDRHYPTMGRADILSVPVADIRAEAAVLFLWTTPQDLGFAIGEVMPAWGFRYSTTGFVWAKLKARVPDVVATADIHQLFEMGLGFHTRHQVEVCLIGTAERVPLRMDAAVGELIVAPRREHSRKPDDQYRRIEAMYSGPRIELFARQAWPGWDTWGLDAEGLQTRTRQCPSHTSDHTRAGGR